MDSSSLQTNQEFQPIPALLQSYETGKPFQTCIACSGDLLAEGSQYVVEKAIRNYPGAGVQDVIFEYAMCLSCAQQLREELSLESKANIEAYFTQRVNLEARREALLALPEPLRLENWLSHCLVTGLPREACTEYQIFGQCFGPELYFGFMPYMLSGQAMEEIQELISPHTRQILDDFMDSHFGLPPELRALLQDRLVLV